ncbi:MAG: type II toxin-antitoxin system VapC family toxin [Gemmataceae bacterium]|nr:type II toxin-antitoxin system VapC family toxin [Gemmataceae bacterium]
MSDVIADTHAIIWHLSDQSRLSPAALAALSTAESAARIWIAVVTLVEMTYLVEKGRVPRAILDELWAAVRNPAEPLDALPLTLDVADVVGRIPRGMVPDLPDRLIAATALAHNLPLVSADRKIRSLSVAGLTVVW